MHKPLKIILVILGIILIVGIGLVLLNVIPLGPPKITQAVVSAQINKDTAEPIDVADEFKPDIPAVYCAIQAERVRGGSVVKAEWYFEGQKLTENNLTVPGENFLYYNRRLYFELKKPEGADWNAGQYEVKLYLDGKLSQTVPFKMKEEAGQAKEATIADAVTCKQVDENYAPKDKTDIFSADTKKIYCSVKISNAQKGAVIKVQWVNKDGDQILDSSNYTVLKDHSAGYIAFSYSIDGQTWKKGNYEVKIYVGNKLIKTTPFKIQ